MATLQSLAMAEVSTETASVAEGLLDSVVLVHSGRGSGSGVIWDADGLIVTNSHVVGGHNAHVILRDGRRLAGVVAARDARRDLAAVRVDARDLPAARIGDSSRIRVGQLVFAVGNPLGLRDVVTAGIVTGAGQATVEERTRLGDLIQADVLLAPGNSGGPLADVEGRVLGINAMISAGGIALAVPSAVVQAFVAPQRGSQPYLGITGTGVRLRTPGKERSAVVLISVEEGSPADRAGLMQGDILLGSGERELESGDDLQIWLASLPPDEAVQLRVLRGGEPREFTVVPTIRVAV